MVESVKDPATVQAIDTNLRTITLALPSGTTATYKVGPKVKHFNHVKVGDKVKATVTEELAVYVLENGRLAGCRHGRNLGRQRQGVAGGSQLPAVDPAISQRPVRDLQARSQTPGWSRWRPATAWWCGPEN